MRVLLQRVSSASVCVETRVTGEIGRGLVLLVGFGDGDDATLLRPMTEKIVHLRVFPDESGRFNRSVLDISGGVLAVPQFTLYADTSRGRRPDFTSALKPEFARPLFTSFIEELQQAGVTAVATGEFGAHMLVSLINDGPVTILLENSSRLLEAKARSRKHLDKDKT